MSYTAEELKKLRCYVVQFWSEDDKLKVNPEQAARIKMAIKSGLNYFELGDDLYMIKEIKRVYMDKAFVDARSTDIPKDIRQLLSTDHYMSNQKLLK